MAGTHTITTFEATGRLRRLVTTWVADASDGSVPGLDISIHGQILLLRTNPGSTAPTDNYDVTLDDADSIDQLQGVGANRDTTTTEEALVIYSSTYTHPYVVDVAGRALTLNVANNSVNSATGTIEITWLQNF